MTSGTDVGMPYGMIDYQQVLRDEAFSISAHCCRKQPCMPRWVAIWTWSTTSNPANGVAPSKNYAREVMQLFSLGLYQLNNDGSYKRGSKGELLDPIARTMSKTLRSCFTGMDLSDGTGQFACGAEPRIQHQGLDGARAQHDYSTQTLMGGSIAGSLTQGQRLNAALDVIFNHPIAAVRRQVPDSALRHGSAVSGLYRPCCEGFSRTMAAAYAAT